MNNLIINKLMMAAVIATVVNVTPVYALEQPIEQYVNNAQKVGQGRLTFMFWDIYDAVLYAPNGQWKSDEPFALVMSYLTDISGEDIAKRSIELIRKQGFDNEIKLADWHTQMKRIFPDVDEGVSLVGIYTQSGETIFLKGSKEVGRVKDLQFGKHFFAIWLGENTSIPDLRDTLLGQ